MHEPDQVAAARRSDLREPLLTSGDVPPEPGSPTRSSAKPGEPASPTRSSAKPGSASGTPIAPRRIQSTRSQEVIFVHSQSAPAEQFNFPHDPDCVHCRVPVERERYARWGTGLCDSCYDRVAKDCHECGCRLALKQLHWNSGRCDNCYDRHKRRDKPKSTPPTDGLKADVNTLIGAQLIFYAAPSAMVPSLYLEIQAAAWSNGDAAAAYAMVLTTTTVVAMAAPVPFGFWAEARGEHEVYVGVTFVASRGTFDLAVFFHICVRSRGRAVGSWGDCWAVSLSEVAATAFAYKIPGR